MDSRDDEDFHRTLEPVVIINDSVEENTNKLPECGANLLSRSFEKDELINSIGPEISIIPVPIRKRKPQVKIRLFQKEYSPSKDITNSTKVQGIISRSPREKVRRVSRDEAINAEDTYAKRKSNPPREMPHM
ncbi:hypothetical protein NQ317_009861 [Molorchus minor]|uniref:Uncharacterized protein n=1 Tax=Molorchus minor TaxID=1323400 RepID=A0ABQ9K1Y1_9CUCU|nr:hypothetical protein NQ317_009861 [Molorchus minor]